MIDEKKLVADLVKRKPEAIERAIKIYTPYISTVLFNIAGNRITKEDVEEIISDVFFVLWKNAEQINLSKGTVRSYLAAVARNSALRRIKEAIEAEPIDELVTEDKSQQLENEVMSMLLWNAVMELGEPDNEIFVRYYKYGERLNDIAKKTGLKLSTVKTKLSRGKIKLRKILEKGEES